MQPRESNCAELTTEDNRTPIGDGMRLYNYYDGKWGTVKFCYDTAYSGWFDLVQDDGTTTSLNGVRVSTKEL